MLLGAGLCIGAWTIEPIELLGIFVGPILVGAAFTLRERAMLGDTGSNLVGAVAGVWLLTTLDDSGRLIALVLIALLTVYGEFRSISAAIDPQFLRCVTRLARREPDEPSRDRETPASSS